MLGVAQAAECERSMAEKGKFGEANEVMRSLQAHFACLVCYRSTSIPAHGNQRSF